MRTRFKTAVYSILFASTALAALAVSAPASAQESVTEVITVTATRRAAGLQDVPLAVTAVSAEQLQRNAIFDISNLDTLAPGLSFGASGSDARPSIRGARTETINERQDPVIGFFIDGFYLPRTSQAFSAFFDLERVEVLRGPQGTLFGRNTFGGAINITSAAPKLDEFDYSASIEYGSFDRIRAEAMINVPLTDTLAFRAAGAIDRDDGYIVNLSDPYDNLGQRDSDNLRAALFWEATDTFDATLRFRHWNQGGNGAGDFGYQTLGTIFNADQTATTLDGTITRTNSRDGAGGPLDPGPYEVFRDTPNSRSTDSYQVDLDLNWDLGPVRLRSLTAYVDYRGYRQTDADFSGSPGQFSSVDTRSETFTQELQLLSPDDGGPLEWIAGVYFLDDDVREDFVFDNICNIPPEDGTDATFRPCIDENPFWASPTTVGFGRSGNVSTTSYAFFGQATYSITEQLRVTGGLRYTNDDKEFFRLGITEFARDASIFTNDPGIIIDPTDFRLFDPDTGEPLVSDTFDKVTWRAGVEYDITDDNLIYFTASTGFNSGGFNTSGAELSFDPQNVRAWEIGSKNSFPDYNLTLNLSAYYNEFTDLLAQGFVPALGDDGVTQTVLVFSTNAGDADVWGIEGEARWEPVDQLILAANFSYTNSELDNYVLGNPFEEGGQDFVASNGVVTSNRVILDGQEVALTPDFTTTLSAQYTYDLGQYGTLTPFLQFFYSTGYRTNDIAIPGTIQDDYTKTDFTLTWMDEDERFSIAGYVQNLENEAVLNRTTVGGGDAIFANWARPRQWGIRFTVRR